MVSRYRCPFKNLLILDFNTTCEENNYVYPTEIIQMSVSVLNIRDKLIREDQTFNRFVCPVINPVLSEYCARKTGIDQNSINTADTFPVVYDQFVAWLREHNFQPSCARIIKPFGLLRSTSFCCLISRCQLFSVNGITLRVFSISFFPKEIMITFLERLTFVDKASNYYNIEIIGNAHNAVDKSTFLAKITKQILDDNNLITVTRSLRCNVTSRRVPLNVDPNWITTFQSAMLVFGRMLPLVPAVVYRYFTDDDYAKCQYCKNYADGCTGLVHKQYPHDVYQQLVEPSVFATAAKLDVDFDVDDEDEDQTIFDIHHNSSSFLKEYLKIVVVFSSLVLLWFVISTSSWFVGVGRIPHSVKTDVWSMGCMLMQMYIGEEPFVFQSGNSTLEEEQSQFKDIIYTLQTTVPEELLEQSKRGGKCHLDLTFLEYFEQEEEQGIRKKMRQQKIFNCFYYSISCSLLTHPIAHHFSK
ncbi:Protein CBG23882 [Caenorhabditis briggsae]|uniref:Protein CBG23882 n=1 Tax=Caenorhabditis briggsae TaxID=6238 RepID=A8WJI0_CAEBR|nr:Protein CBG23882 [Caenorhabditis briggsae]CAP20622.2 Protein CBG23882 [Caenorhabditis briggsae]